MSWPADSADRFDAANRETLNWVLARQPLAGAFLDTKVNPLTGADYGAADGLRGPDWTYGWIQGRGLEALASFARHYADSDPAFAERLLARMRPLYHRLVEISADWHAYFLYDAYMQPVRPEGTGVVSQTRPEEVFTFADAFVAKGLVAAAALIDRPALPGHLAYLHRVVAAIESGRFQIDEKVPLSPAAAAAGPDDFGPRMILLGAAGMLARAGLSAEAEPWASRFIDHVLTHHFDTELGVLRNIPGDDAFNAGHGIEFVGFAFDHLPRGADPDLVGRLKTVLDRSLALAMRGPGIALSLSLKSKELLLPYYPWWKLPEAIRACALALRQGDDERMATWGERAEQAFFDNFWQPGTGYAYQTLTEAGPVDFVPATPDLDPGYHTGLSLLAAAVACPTD
ncbi:hypothetical protein [Frigidibacter sp. ROC022]|uniref:hypothetical protein n=1 Tax=Frigidibacter sp. ROC022 TaxID=2971796 RepID=UPI00215AAE6D|nr:hypothetical protein [Frigidibacter sp. ROC022]MCR8724577.1 hypothetical protein [Frigidibacter sp. ROC022]